MLTNVLINGEICAACFIQLPVGYLFDHVAIDRAVAGDPAVFAAMGDGERREVVLTALAHGASLRGLAETLHWDYSHILRLRLLTEQQALEEAHTDQVVRELWSLDLPDVVISARSGINPTRVGRVRKRLGLPTRFGSRGRRVDLPLTDVETSHGGVS